MKPPKPECAKCGIREKICSSPQGEGPAFCPTIHRRATVEKANSQYSKEGVKEFARQASIQEAECYADRGPVPYILHPVKTRLQETCEFAKRMGYKKIGIAFCAGLAREAKTLTEILEAQGFVTVSVVCKAGGTPKETLGLREEQKIHIGKFESMCSPIAQAMILNEEKTDFNVLVGLCVGHDSLFLKNADAYSTVLVAKDRVLAHNPAAALYTFHSYYRRLTREGI